MGILSAAIVSTEEPPVLNPLAALMKKVLMYPAQVCWVCSADSLASIYIHAPQLEHDCRALMCVCVFNQSFLLSQGLIRSVAYVSVFNKNY